MDHRKVGLNFGSDPECILTPMTATTLRLLNFAYSGDTVLYCYNGQYNINLLLLHARTFCSSVTTLCRFQLDVAEVCLLPSAL